MALCLQSNWRSSKCRERETGAAANSKSEKPIQLAGRIRVEWSAGIKGIEKEKPVGVIRRGFTILSLTVTGVALAVAMRAFSPLLVIGPRFEKVLIFTCGA